MFWQSSVKETIAGRRQAAAAQSSGRVVIGEWRPTADGSRTEPEPLMLRFRTNDLGGGATVGNWLLSRRLWNRTPVRRDTATTSWTWCTVDVRNTENRLQHHFDRCTAYQSHCSGGKKTADRLFVSRYCCPCPVRAYAGAGARGGGWGEREKNRSAGCVVVVVGGVQLVAGRQVRGGGLCDCALSDDVGPRERRWSAQPESKWVPTTAPSAIIRFGAWRRATRPRHRFRLGQPAGGGEITDPRIQDGRPWAAADPAAVQSAYAVPLSLPSVRLRFLCPLCPSRLFIAGRICSSSSNLFFVPKFRRWQNPTVHNCGLTAGVLHRRTRAVHRCALGFRRQTVTGHRPKCPKTRDSVADEVFFSVPHRPALGLADSIDTNLMPH